LESVKKRISFATVFSAIHLLNEYNNDLLSKDTATYNLAGLEEVLGSNTTMLKYHITSPAKISLQEKM